MRALTEIAVKLLLRDDDLAGRGTVGVGDIVIQDADGTDNLACNTCLVEARNVGWVADDERSTCTLLTATNTACSAIAIEKNLINVRVEHVGTTVDSTETRERLRQASKAVHWVQERRVTVLAHRLHIQLHFLAGVNCRGLEIGVLDMKGDSVAQEVDCLGLEAE